MLWRGMDKLQDAMDVKLMKRSLKWGLVVMVLGGIAVYYAESALVESDNDVKTLGGGCGGVLPQWSPEDLVTFIIQSRSLVGF